MAFKTLFTMFLTSCLKIGAKLHARTRRQRNTRSTDIGKSTNGWHKNQTTKSVLGVARGAYMVKMDASIPCMKI